MKRNAGFTLIELLICLAVVAALVTAGTIMGNRQGKRTGYKKAQVEAVEFGVGQWVVQDTEGTVGFQWQKWMPTWETTFNVTTENVHNVDTSMWPEGTILVPDDEPGSLRAARPGEIMIRPAGFLKR